MQTRISQAAKPFPSPVAPDYSYYVKLDSLFYFSLVFYLYAKLLVVPEMTLSDMRSRDMTKIVCAAYFMYLRT